MTGGSRQVLYNSRWTPWLGRRESFSAEPWYRLSQRKIEFANGTAVLVPRLIESRDCEPEDARMCPKKSQWKGAICMKFAKEIG